MKPIQHGDIGAAVEDIQRRLRVSGYDLGSGGIDGYFGPDTQAAVDAFQRAKGINPTAAGVVGPRTWSALVDSTFELGDRMLYLRLPHFHGADVATLQRALNSLGFVTGGGGADGIYGSYTERAVADFQQNYELVVDGIVGVDTFAALFALRHMWDGKTALPHSSTVGAPRELLLVLLTNHFAFEIDGEEQDSDGTLQRLVRLANEIEQAARADMTQRSASTPGTVTRVQLSICGEGVSPEAGRTPHDHFQVTYICDYKMLAKALDEGYQFRNGAPAKLRVCIPVDVLYSNLKSSVPLGLQHVATALLNALCLVVSQASEQA